MSLIRRAVQNARPSARSGPIMPWSIPSPEGFSVFGREQGETGALSVSTVVNCIRVLSDDMGILPFRAYEGDPHGTKRIIAEQPQIVADPFGGDLPVQNGMGMIVTSMKLRGRAFLYVAERDKRGYPIRLQIVHPDMVQVKQDDLGKKTFRVNGADYASSEFVHLRGLMLPGALDGVDPVTYQRVTLGLAADLNEFSRSLFQNGAMPSGVIEVQGDGDRKRARDIAASWQAGHSGMVNAHKPAVLFNASWKPMAITPENAQFLATKGFLREEIAGWFGVPLQRLMVTTAHASQGGGRGLDTIDQGYATHTLLPLARQIEGAWDRMIPGDSGTWAQFDFAGLLRASALERAQIANLHRMSAIRTTNEIRADEGYAPLEDPRANDVFMPLNTNSSTVFPSDAATGSDQAPVDIPTDEGTS